MDFRELVLGLENDKDDLIEKLRKLDQDQNNNTAHHHNNITYHHHHHRNHTINSATTITTTASPTIDDQRTTNSSTSGSTQTTSGLSSLIVGPPAYKSVFKQTQTKPEDSKQQQSQDSQNKAPKPPTRTKKKSATLASSRDLKNNMTTTVAGRGALIVLEGLDRVGKSTLAKKLVQHLENTNRPVTYCRFPERSTPVGGLIDECLKSSSKRVEDHVMHLLFSANRWEMNKAIRTNIERGTTVIIDRYSYSGMAYSSVKLDLNWCREVEKGLPKPDLVIYLELSKEVQYTRAGFGDERFETREMQEKTRIQYEKVMDMSKETWLRIDVDNKSPDQVLGEIIMPVKRCLESCSSKDLGSLDFYDA